MKSERYPICDKGVLQREVKNEIFKYNGKSITIPDYIVHRCNQGGEAIVDNATLKESGKTLKASSSAGDRQSRRVPTGHHTSEYSMGTVSA